MTSKVRVVCALPLDDDVFREIVLEFSDKLRVQVDRMKLAYAAEEWNELVELGHWLKGSGGTAGYEQFTIPSGRLERLASQHSHSKIEAVLNEIDELAKAVAEEMASLPADGLMDSRRTRSMNPSLLSAVSDREPAGTNNSLAESMSLQQSAVEPANHLPPQHPTPIRLRRGCPNGMCPNPSWRTRACRRYSAEFNRCWVLNNRPTPRSFHQRFPKRSAKQG